LESKHYKQKKGAGWLIRKLKKDNSCTHIYSTATEKIITGGILVFTKTINTYPARE
jgi:hypothetical protein